MLSIGVALGRAQHESKSAELKVNNKILGVIVLAAAAAGIGYLSSYLVHRPAVAEAQPGAEATASTGAMGQGEETVRASLARIIPGAEPDMVRPSPLPQTYEVIFGAQIMYVTADGRYVLQGDLIDLENRVNVSEQARSSQRKQLVAAIDPGSEIVFSPEGKPRHVITVFTDIDCGYCRKLHREIDQYLDRGIEIRYASFPRAGRNSKSYFKAVSVWCSDDRQAALTRSKNGEELPPKECEHPVDAHMKVAEEIGISGTPTLVMADGEVVPGYVPAGRLASMLEQQ